MTRILQIIDTTGPGGAETVYTELCRHFGSTYAIYATLRGPGWVKEQLEAIGTPHRVLDCKGSFNIRFLLALRKLIVDERIDLIHAHLLGSSVYASLAGLLTGRPVISTFHGSVDIARDERFAGVKMGVVKRLSTLVAVSRELREELAFRTGLDAQAIRLIPNGIDCQRFAAARPSRAAGHAERDAAPVIGCLGNIRPAKAYHLALQAISLLRESGTETRLVIAGHCKEPLISELTGLRDQLGLTDLVQFVGFVEQPEDFLGSIDLFLLSSTSEGHPLALTQAMAAGLPIVATRCGVENLIDERTAWLADNGDAASIAGAIQQALQAPAEAAKRGAAAQQEAFAHYDFGAMFSGYENLYNELLT